MSPNFIKNPPGPGDDIQLAAALDRSEQPLPVPAAYGDVEPGDAAELTAASTSKPDSCDEADKLVSGDVPPAAAPGEGVDLPPQESEGFTEEIKRSQASSYKMYSRYQHGFDIFKSQH
ncbi:Transforming acidic coiled-coil-containing protein 2 isoform X4 [Aix galericulata]|nr:Transforming acidic coiled-coil-containing protein 2 isoform X4 [Aix galericulata]